MRVQLFWRDCTYWRKSRQVIPIDAFWIEATQEKAAAGISPWLQPAQVAESHQLARQYGEIAKVLDGPARAYCFLVARDLNSIDPLPPNYPTHLMWNAY